MSKVPSLFYRKIIKALERGNWTVVRQKGSHIRLEKKLIDETLKITVPAHKPVKRTTLAKILKQAKIDLDDFLKLIISQMESRLFSASSQSLSKRRSNASTVFYSINDSNLPFFYPKFPIKVS